MTFADLFGDRDIVVLRATGEGRVVVTTLTSEVAVELTGTAKEIWKGWSPPPDGWGTVHLSWTGVVQFGLEDRDGQYEWTPPMEMPVVEEGESGGEDQG